MTRHVPLRHLNVLHVLNDGFYASLLLLLPFIANELHLSLTQAGLLGTLMNSLGMLFALPAGYIAARVGGMKVLILSVFLYGLGYLGTGLVPSYLLLFPAFIAAGIGFALFHPIALALVARFSAPAARGRAMGNFTAIGDMGRMGISAALTFIVVSLGWRSTALLYGAVSVGIGLVFLWWFRRNRERPVTSVPQKVSIRMRDVLSMPRFLFATLTSFFDVFAGASLFVFLPFLLLFRGIEPAFLGTFSAIFFLGNLLGKSALGRFSDRFKNANIVILSEMLSALCIVALANSTSMLMIILFAFIAGIFTKGTVPVIQTMIADASEHHGHFEKSFALNGLTVSIALTISPVVLGFISDQWGIVTAFHTMAAIAAMAAVPALLFRMSHPRHETMA